MLFSLKKDFIKIIHNYVVGCGCICGDVGLVYCVGYCVCVGVGILVVLCVTGIMCDGYVSFKAKVGGVGCVSFIEICVWCS